MNEIAVLDYRLLPDAQEQIQALAANQIAFPAERCPENERINRTGSADVALVTPWDKIDAAYLDTFPDLKYIGLCGTSTANIDLGELERRGIAFSNIVSGDKESVAEFFFMQLVSLARGFGEHQWKPGEEHELVGRRIGIIGLGEVGKAMAHMALAYKDLPGVIFSRAVAGDTYESNERRGKRAVENLKNTYLPYDHRIEHLF